MAVIQRNVANLKGGIAGLLTGTNLAAVKLPYNALERAFRTFSQKCAIPEAMTASPITLYDGVFDYISPAPIFGSTIKDMRPVGVSRSHDDYAIREGIEDFDRTKEWKGGEGFKVTFETRNAVNIMRAVSKFTFQKTVIDPMNQVSDNSSGNNEWVAGGIASGLQQDTSVYYASPASLRFNLTGAGIGNIAKTLDNPINMSNFNLVGSVFLELNLPALNLSNVVLQLGTNASNYYQVTATQGMLGKWTTGSFLDTPFDLSTATIVGTPNIKSIQYVNLIFTTTATITNIRCGYLFASLPSQAQVLYSTTGIFQAQDGSINNFITNDNDVILLTDAAYNIYEHECALTIALQNGGTLSGGITAIISAVLNGSYTRTGKVITLGLYDKYKADNPSENITMVGNWYND